MSFWEWLGEVWWVLLGVGFLFWISYKFNVAITPVTQDVLGRPEKRIDVGCVVWLVIGIVFIITFVLGN